MRFYGFVLLASATILGACGGGDKLPSGDTATQTPTPTPTPTPAGAVAKAPATGKTVEVKMVQTAAGFEFQPKDITVNQGDAIKFIVVGVGPHNVAFQPTDIPEAVRPQLQANMDNPPTELSSPILLNAGDSVTISFASIPPGKYPFNCTPHLVMGMTGTITVQ
jgi:plastocyanin